MPGYQPRHDTDPVWFDGTQVNSLSVSSAQTGVRITAVHGWDDRPDVRDVREFRAGQDGEYADNLYLGGRTITLEGEVYGSSWANLQSRKRSLAALFQPSSDEALLKIPDPSESSYSYEQLVLSLSPVAYWPLDEAVGSTTAEDVAGTYDGSINGNPVFGVTGTIWDGTTALDLDGTGDDVQVTYNAALNPSAFTVAAWVKRDTDSGGIEYIVDSRNAGATLGWGFRVSSTDKLELVVGDGAAVSVAAASSASLSTATWYHVVATFSSGSAALYINGSADGTGSDTYSANTTANLRIGSNTSSASRFYGPIQHVAVWNSALTAAQVSRLYSYALTQYQTTGMVGYERVSARVVEAIQFGDTLDPMCQVFQVILRASDPRVYSDVEVSTDSTTSGTSARTVTVDQGGSYETPPTITVTGPTSSVWRVADSNDETYISVSDLVLASESVAIDVADRTMTLQGSYAAIRYLDADNIAVWMLNETSGTTADNAEGTSAYDGTYTGGFTLNQSGHASGLASVDLDGSTGYVSIPHSNALFPSVFTFEGWIRLDSLSGGGGTGDVPIIDGQTSSRGWELTYSDTNGFYVTIGNGSTTDSVLIPTVLDEITTGTWYHIALVFDSSNTATLYVDSRRVGSATPSITYAPATSGGYRFGRSMGGTEELNGRIDAYAIFGAAKTGTDIRALYEASASSGVVRSVYGNLDADTAAWSNLGTDSTTYTLYSNNLNTGSKLNVTYRDARL